MKQQKNFNWFKIVTISMYVIGIGGILYSLFCFVRLHRSDEPESEMIDENQVANDIPRQTSSPPALRKLSNTLLDEQYSEEGIREALAWLDSLKKENPSSSEFDESEESSAFTDEKPLKEVHPETSGRKYAYGLSREEANRQGAELRVELENLLYTSIDMEADIHAGVAAASQIPDKAAKEREFERLGELSDEQAALKMEILELEFDYVGLSEDYEAAMPGGWLFELKQKLHLGYSVYE